MRGDGKPFAEGQSGNPAGRPRGSRNRATLALETILDGDAEAIVRKAIELAREGEPQALRMCLDRLLPVRRERPVRFELPEITTTDDLPKATSALLQAVASGDITPSEAADVGHALAAHMRAIETASLNERMRRIEEDGAR
ncbi:DUF5681 domain-containing protein [Methylobacterium thuringiense]|uniref:DUF5681 domain-containing protein n=1 Tax=Methylobacterium thuringiense TaxID=1003091 RepID=A0ABQ4TQW2_9HYPH|nr:DUF5681 domain-containing protein [Methylobacterium thuringiense]GJE57749.1 hypothetical protein EKPJFOCH_4267 [Methylobacterium thuringiense]